MIKRRLDIMGSVEALENELLSFIEVVKDCKQCGECCKNKKICLTLTEVGKIEEFTKKPYKSFAKVVYQSVGSFKLPQIVLKRRGEDCWFLKDGKCGIHPVKPLQCRTYPVLFNHVILEELKKLGYCWEEGEYYYFKCVNESGMIVRVKKGDFERGCEIREKILEEEYVKIFEWVKKNK